MKMPFWPDIKGYRNIELGLDRVHKLLDRLGNPQNYLPPVIHIAGTNGKGSLLYYTKSILEQHGHKVHYYLSPHLVEFNERIYLAGKRGGKNISDEYLTEILHECQAAAETEPLIDVTFFEGITVAAILAFSRVKADFLILETGMGGRLDATNIIEDPLLTIITSISNDHSSYLGNSIEKIAFEKAGIIKQNCPLVTLNQSKEVMDVLTKIATEKNAQIFADESISYTRNEKEFNVKVFGSILKLNSKSFPAEYNANNAAMAALAASVIKDKIKKFSLKKVTEALNSTKLPARIQKITFGRIKNSMPHNYEIYIDGAHNEGGAVALVNWIRSMNKIKKKPTYLVFSMMAGKDIGLFLKAIRNEIDYLFCVPMFSTESYDTKEMAAMARSININAVFADDINQALVYAITINRDQKFLKNRTVFSLMRLLKIFKLFDKFLSEDARIVFCGSLHFAGEVLELNQEKK